MCFVLQIINFHCYNTSLKYKYNKGYLKFVFTEFYTCIFYNEAVSKKTFLSWTKYILFTEDSKMWMIHLYIQEICVILQLKKQKGDVLQKDIE